MKRFLVCSSSRRKEVKRKQRLVDFRKMWSCFSRIRNKRLRLNKRLFMSRLFSYSHCFILSDREGRSSRKILRYWKRDLNLKKRSLKRSNQNMTLISENVEMNLNMKEDDLTWNEMITLMSAQKMKRRSNSNSMNLKIDENYFLRKNQSYSNEDKTLMQRLKLSIKNQWIFKA